MKEASEEIAEELEHHRSMLQNLRRRLRKLEVKVASFGRNAPAEDLIEIEDIQSQILRHETEVKRLQTEFVEDKLTLAEAEFRAALARAWDTPRGTPTVVGTTQLELERLRLGIPMEQAQRIETEVRLALAKERLEQVYFSDTIYGLLKISSEIGKTLQSKEVDANKEVVSLAIKLYKKLDELVSMIRLDRDAVINWLATERPNFYWDTKDIENLVKILIIARMRVRNPNRQLYINLLTSLQDIIKINILQAETTLDTGESNLP